MRYDVAVVSQVVIIRPYLWFKKVLYYYTRKLITCSDNFKWSLSLDTITLTVSSDSSRRRHRSSVVLLWQSRQFYKLPVPCLPLLCITCKQSSREHNQLERWVRQLHYNNFTRRVDLSPRCSCERVSCSFGGLDELGQSFSLCRLRTFPFKNITASWNGFHIFLKIQRSGEKIQILFLMHIDECQVLRNRTFRYRFRRFESSSFIDILRHVLVEVEITATNAGQDRTGRSKFRKQTRTHIAWCSYVSTDIVASDVLVGQLDSAHHCSI